MRRKATYGINPPFGGLFRTQGQVAHVLRTRSPLSTKPKFCFSFDLHVLTMPPAFTLSQDQTLQKRVVLIKLHRLELIYINSVFKKIWPVTHQYRSHKITFKEQPLKNERKVSKEPSKASFVKWKSLFFHFFSNSYFISGSIRDLTSFNQRANTLPHRKRDWSVDLSNQPSSEPNISYLYQFESIDE